jgi:hypothetical protein
MIKNAALCIGWLIFIRENKIGIVTIRKVWMPEVPSQAQQIFMRNIIRVSDMLGFAFI